MRRSVVPAAVMALLMCSAAPASAQTATQDLRLATLEELMRIEVTSVSRREQRAEDAAAAVHIIGRDEIRRSGMTSIPELLRLAPGVDVARINSNKWAVSVRGFNSLYSNKLLVMVDGRSIYNPAFSTVLWDTEDLMIEDIDRIEVIRGPGGAMWGANAVNGVINIITRPSSDTRGGLARLGSGTFDTASAAIRYGGAVGSATYRVYTQGAAYGDSLSEPGAAANDAWRSVTGGFRADWARGRDAVMFQGAVTSGRQQPLWIDLASPAARSGRTPWQTQSATEVANVLGRWTRTGASGAAFQAQAYFDHGHRDEAIAAYTRRTWDVDAQYHAALGSRHDLMAGGGYRYIVEAMQGRGGYAFTPDRVRPRIANGFVQDAIAMADRRAELTVGAKFENSTFAGGGLQPNARMLWRISPGQRAWAAVSRALRTPSLIDRGVHVEYPARPWVAGARDNLGAPNSFQDPALLTLPDLIVGAVGNPAFHSERLLNTEGGYRLNVGSSASVDVVGFVGRYDDLQTYEPQAPVIDIVNGLPQIKVLARADNGLRSGTRGAEVSGRVQLTDAWRIDGAFSAFHLTAVPGDSLDPSVADYEGNAPSRHWRAHVGLPVGPRGQADVHVFRIGPLRRLAVPPYTRIDVRLEWPLSGRLSAIASGQNLLQGSHAEFYGHETHIESTLLPRSAALRLVWRF